MSDTTYADGTYGGSAEASRDLERDQHAAFTDQQAVVLALAFDAGATGITGHDVQEATGWGDSPKSRAMSNLLRDGKLARLREKRDRGSVHVLPEHVNGRPTEPYRSIAQKHHADGYAEGLHDGIGTGLDRAFTIVDNSDTIGDALIALRRLIEDRQA
ncbi:helix-turn-helix DNA binding domain protein [Microbacterium phage Smarties]|uniref:Helix-turn-helix DNA-binding domain protein n=1 Tax=Microbacterium phage Ariadne TaxID=2656546 RepID=A0A649VBX9_9CAUD|nr:helix-turn-helix DNA-binding domain protein [Microbacterium phage Ariadne]QGJ89472.1 helix-turn-helix DNA-binding domain protein [Microbacterium phage Ariadne]QGJ91459.1 helix-turn-helix DNA binding domain protein [Microbacterium phage Smarties]